MYFMLLSVILADIIDNNVYFKWIQNCHFHGLFQLSLMVLWLWLAVFRVNIVVTLFWASELACCYKAQYAL